MARALRKSRNYGRRWKLASPPALVGPPRLLLAYGEQGVLEPSTRPQGELKRHDSRLFTLCCLLAMCLFVCSLSLHAGAAPGDSAFCFRPSPFPEFGFASLSSPARGAACDARLLSARLLCYPFACCLSSGSVCATAYRKRRWEQRTGVALGTRDLRFGCACFLRQTGKHSPMVGVVQYPKTSHRLFFPGYQVGLRGKVEALGP
jgi:hypothetical protein